MPRPSTEPIDDHKMLWLISAILLSQYAEIEGQEVRAYNQAVRDALGLLSEIQRVQGKET